MTSKPITHLTKPIRHLTKNNEGICYITCCGVTINKHPSSLTERRKEGFTRKEKRTTFIVKKVNCKRCQKTPRYKTILAKHIARRLKGHI